MTQDFLIETTYDKIRGQVVLNAYRLMRGDFPLTASAVSDHHPALRPFATLGLTQDDVDTLFTDSAEHIVLASNFEEYFEIDFGLLDERVEEFFGSLPVYAEQDTLEKKLK